ncbi:hypothetical protein [Flavobacterium sp.]|uniref:hypothetical protein n=1 Tax=Flavobacterium sp. TaxID=239 RepID=UPI003D6C3E47
MAKVSWIIKIEGTVEGLTFYKIDGVSYVRKKGDISKERIGSEPNFVRTRENNLEFGHSGTSGKALRNALGSMVLKAKDSKLTSRLMGVMLQVKNTDAVSLRGSGRVSVGLETAEGKQVLRGFDFNANAHLNGVLFAPYSLNMNTGVVSLTNFIPSEQVHFLEGATHVSFQSAILVLDFDTKDSEIAYSPIVNKPLNLTLTSVTLTPANIPAGSGQQFFLLLISFYQQVNGVQYSLKNEEYNVLNILEVV